MECSLLEQRAEMFKCVFRSTERQIAAVTSVAGSGCVEPQVNNNNITGG